MLSRCIAPGSFRHQTHTNVCAGVRRDNSDNRIHEEFLLVVIQHCMRSGTVLLRKFDLSAQAQMRECLLLGLIFVYQLKIVDVEFVDTFEFQIPNSVKS